MAAPRRVAVFIGSLRAESFNRRLALALGKLAGPALSFEHIRIDDLPHYNQDHDGSAAEASRRLKREVEAADALLFVTPEYNRSMPGVLKNAIDIASRPYGKNSFASKPAGVIGTSIGQIGTALAQQHLRNVLAYLDVPVMGQPEAFIQYTDGLIDDAGNVSKESTAKFLGDWIKRYAAWVETHLAAR
ncbi:MAG: NAD(P)H-dependent oxidoreductase [Proteobacteria bacterium]|nr:NAD(P)H-dependent oxidoreductase [Pseudomonadota bacterium]